ncbi:MAG: DUF4012 domain-containing protein [Patescibacteria group bacterium]|nr:DUF4012 domain-containing protein [Patescibacteria group bacterium]
MKQTPNLLTCPGVPELPAPKGGNLKLPEKPELPKLEKSYGRKRKWIKWTVLAIVVILCILLIQPMIALGKAGFAAYEAKQAIDSLKYGLQTGDYSRAVNEAGRAKAAMEDFNQALQGVGFLRDFPFIGTQIKAVQDVSAVAVSSLDSAEDLLKVASGMAGAVETGQENLGTDVGIASGRSWQDLSVSEKRDLLRVLQQKLPDIRLARDKIDMALALWDAVPKGRMLPVITKALSPLADMLPILRKAMDQSVPLLETAIPLAGYPEPKQYLVILQNSDEMRPAGGFIGSIANVTLDSGDIKDFIFSDVYNVDNPVSGVWKEVPPEPLAKNLGVKAWFMRDANWSPDFVESASRVLDFYKREMELQGKPDKPDGVIAIEPGFFRELLRLIGPVEIQGKTYDDRNFMDLLEYQVEMGFLQEGVKLEDRKAILGELGTRLMQKIQAMPKSDWPKLINLITQALSEKQIMIYTTDQSLQASVDRLGWSGRVKPTVCDFAWVVDANLAALKTDGKMVKSMSYELDASNPQKPVATMTLTYRNTTTQSNWRYTRYRSYTRLYVPEGSQFISSKGAMAGDLLQTGGKFVPGKVDVMKELGKTVFGAFWAIEPGKTGQLSFTYALPPSVSDCLAQNKYVLDWQKQAGNDGAELNVRILMPSVVKTADPAEPEIKWGDAVYEAQTDSQTDRSYKVKY